MNILQKTKTNRIISFILLALTLLWSYFIFSMSTKTAVESSAISSGMLKKILEYIQGLLWFDVEFFSLHHFFRKLAHFTEYFILGFLTVSYLKSIKMRPVYSLIYCLAIAVFDECLQYRTGAGRSMQISDMLLDFSGSCCAVIIFYILSVIIFHLRKKRINKIKSEHTF